MNRRELTDRLAKQAHTTRAKAADQVDSLVYGLLKEMKENAKPPAKDVAAGAPKPPAATDSGVKTPAKRKK